MQTLSTAMITTGILRESSPYHHIFLEGKVPLLSKNPCRPAEDKPLSYMINSGLLTSLQKELLARLLNHANPDKSHGDCLHAIHKGVAIDCKWFAGLVHSPYDLRLPQPTSWEIAGQIEAWLNNNQTMALVALLNIACREQTNLSHQVKEWGFDDIPGHVIKLIDDLDGQEYLEIAYHLSTSLLETLSLEEA